MCLEELTERITYALGHLASEQGKIAVGIFLLHDSPELRDQILKKGYAGASHYCEAVFRISNSAVSWYKRCGDALIKYHKELSESGFQIRTGLYKLAFLEKALERYEDRGSVFGALSLMSFKGFKKFATGMPEAKEQVYSPFIQNKASPYLNRMKLIEARGEIPIAFELYFQWEKAALLYYYAQYQDSEHNESSDLYNFPGA